MNYRSISDLSHSIRANLDKLPGDIDLVVGVPRSGMLVASMIALGLDVKVIDLEGFCAGSPLGRSNTRVIHRSQFDRVQDASHVLFVDDSISSGASMRAVRERVAQCGYEQRHTFCAVYAAGQAHPEADIVFEHVPDPRTFEWNTLHRPMAGRFCVDIDGVLCVDPTDSENDDGENYRAFLASARPLVIPSHRVGHLVTSRLEKYRDATEAWLSAQGVEYDQLHMLDLPDARTRRELGCHASFKAQVYQSLADTTLFIESDREQARKIAAAAGKPVLSFSTQELFEPGVSYPVVAARSRTLASKVRRLLSGSARRG